MYVSNLSGFTAPKITSVTASASSVVVGNTLTFSVNATDANGHLVLYRWSDNCGDGFKHGATMKTVTWTGPSVGTCTIKVDVRDVYDAFATATLNVSVLAGTPAPGPGAAQVEVEANAWPYIDRIPRTPTGFASQAYDPDGDPLTYAWSLVNCAGRAGAGQNTTFAWSSVPAGACTVRLTVSDGRGGSATGDVTIDNSSPPVQFGP